MTTDIDFFFTMEEMKKHLLKLVIANNLHSDDRASANKKAHPKFHRKSSGLLSLDSLVEGEYVVSE